MTREQGQPDELKIQAFQVFQTLYEQQIPSWPRLAGEFLVEEFGISQEEASHLAFQFIEAQHSNRLAGGTTQLPEIREKLDDTPYTEVEKGAAWFALEYAAQAIGKPPTYGRRMDYWGRWWLGNSEEDTRSLVSWMKENPLKVADYLDWAHGKPDPQRTVEYTQTLFRQKAQEGSLVDPV